MKRFVRFWMPVFIWMAVIFAFSSRQKVAITDSYTVSFLFFKTLHLIEYAVLYILLYRALKNSGAEKTSALLISFGILAMYAGTDEIHQSFVPTREGRLRDGIIDVLGGGIGWIILTQLLPIAPKKLKRLAGNWQLL